MQHACCPGIARRTLLADTGMGFTGLVLGSMLFRDGVVRAASSVSAHRPARAKSVIWLFMVGGASHMESFDPKPALTRYAGKTIGESPYKNVLASSHLQNLRIHIQGDANGHIRQKLYPLQVGFKKRGKSGIAISDWWPHVGDCIDDIAVIRSMWTTDNNHGAQLQFHTGRHVLEVPVPPVASWV